MEWLRSLERFLHRVVLARDIGDVVAGPEDVGDQQPSWVRRMIDAALYGVMYGFAFVTDVIQNFAPFSYVVCGFLAVLLVPPTAKRLASLVPLRRAAAPPARPVNLASRPASEATGDLIPRLQALESWRRKIEGQISSLVDDKEQRWWKEYSAHQREYLSGISEILRSIRNEIDQASNLSEPDKAIAFEKMDLALNEVEDKLNGRFDPKPAIGTKRQAIESSEAMIRVGQIKPDQREYSILRQRYHVLCDTVKLYEKKVMESRGKTPQGWRPT
jgi:hypothetical protein